MIGLLVRLPARQVTRGGLPLAEPWTGLVG